MEFEALIQKRRSVRAYKEQPIDLDILKKIVEQAEMAPSWKNMQASRTYVAASPEVLENLRANGLPGFNANSSRNAALIVSTYVKGQVGFTKGEADNELGDKWGVYDLGLHDAYLILAAANAGLDTLIMGLRDAEQIRRILSIPEVEEIVSVIAVGYREKDPVLRPRKELGEIAKFF